MDVNHKTLKTTLFDGGKDRISSLPDSILRHILSFLPTKCAVATSVLSSRWKNLWTAVSIFELNGLSNSDGVENQIFINFVERVLLLHDSNIHKFHLQCNLPDLSRLNSWIPAILLRLKSQDVHLQIFEYGYDNNEFVFPPCLFTSEALIRLYIQMSCVFKLPNFIQLSNLKDLSLDEVVFSGDDVLFDFPSLVSLSLWCCKLSNIKSMGIRAPTLQELDIHEMESDSVFHIEVYAKRIIPLKLTVTGAFPCKSSLVVHDFASGDNTFIEIYDMDITLACKLLRQISYVTELIISKKIVDLFGEDHSTNPLTLPCVTKMTVQLREECFEFKTLMSSLQCLPNLESLVIYTAWFMLEEDGWSLKTMPNCLISHLKSVEFEGFVGDMEALFVAEFFLENARVLERLTIRYPKPGSSGYYTRINKKEVWEKLLMFPRSSDNCTIEFL